MGRFRQWAVALPTMLAATTALACSSVAYAPRPPSEQRVSTPDELARSPLTLRMSAGGKAVLYLPLADVRGTWSVTPEPLEAVAIHRSFEGKGKARVSRHDFDYRRLNPYEVAVLESGKASELASTRWKIDAERVIPLRLSYHVGKRTLREYAGALHVDRGIEVLLPPEPVVIELRRGEKPGATLSAGREFVVRLPLDTVKVWRIARAEAELEPAIKGPLPMNDDGIHGAMQEFRGVAHGRNVRLRFEANTDATTPGMAIDLELPVQPTPKC